MKIFRLFRKKISLRIVNLLGLSIMLTCLLLSASYIKHELSYDRYITNSDHIVRMSLQFNNEPVDGRILGNTLDNILQQIPEVDRMVKMYQVNNAVLKFQGTHLLIKDFYMVNRDFLNVFDIHLLYGDKNEALQQENQMMVSESLARKLFGELSFDQIQISEISLEGQKFLISGIFKDIPKNSHFHTDVLLHRPDEWESYTYTYLLLKNKTDIQVLSQKITKLAEEKELYPSTKLRVLLMPLTDIHLHSRNLREMSVNGNIHYIYLIVGINMLLLVVVFFNLWLSSSLLFSYNRHYYQLLRLHGASPSAVIKDEVFMALLLGIFSIIIGVTAFCWVSSFGVIAGQISVLEAIMLSLIFLLFVIIVSLFPVLKGISYTLFLNTEKDLKPIRFSYSNVKWMITLQYIAVMITVILSFGINKQMNFVKKTQVGGNKKNILVLAEQPEKIRAKYDLLKSELLKHPEIESVTTSFQMPGDAIRDIIRVRREDKIDWQQLPILITGEDFLSFFDIRLIAGKGFSNTKYDYQTEQTLQNDHLENEKKSEHIEEYVINRKALTLLGFNTPNEAIGEMLQIEHGTIDYFQRGIIAGVTDDFNYTGLYEETIPLLLMQRRMYQYCIMVRIDNNRFQQARSVFEKVWNDVYTEFRVDYVFMDEVFSRKYRNEINAQQLVYIFSLLCFLIADLGLIVFMAFIIKRRTREIGIRKVYGAGIGDIIQMINMNFFRYFILAFAIAVPVAWYIMHRWLQQFAYKTPLHWWIFVLAGFIVVLISFASVSMQSWRAATTNPIDSITKQ